MTHWAGRSRTNHCGCSRRQVIFEMSSFLNHLKIDANFTRYFSRLVRSGSFQKIWGYLNIIHRLSRTKQELGLNMAQSCLILCKIFPAQACRFEPPKPRSPWSGILDCTKFGFACMQNQTFPPDSPDAKEPKSEDCLNVNVIVIPEICNEKHPCPVLTVYIAGAWYFDSINHFPPDVVIDRWASTGLVVVAAAYRAGTLGFWNTGTDDARRNYALYGKLCSFVMDLSMISSLS